MQEIPASEPPLANEVTSILQEWSAGSADALSRLMPLVYDQLRAMARLQLLRERSGHTLQPTALVHEAFLRLTNQPQITWEGRTHFFGLAARVMRRVLVDHARSRQAERRGGSVEKLPLGDEEIPMEATASGLLALDSALEKLSQGYPRHGQVVEMKFFGGLEAKEISEALQVSEKTVQRDWTFAKLWLCRELRATFDQAGSAPA